MIRVREFGHLRRAAPTRDGSSLDHAYLDEATFDALRETLGGDSDEGNQALLRFSSRRQEGCDAIQVRNHLGVIAIGDTQVEILPKVGSGEDSEARKALWKMLQTVYDAEFREASEARLADGHSLLECFIGAFLDKLARLVKRGLRSAYVAHEENLLFLKGRLLVNANLRHNLVLRHRFYVAHDEFVTDRPENRLLHAALLKVEKLSRSLQNRRLCRELRLAFADVPSTARGSVGADLAAWRLDRGAGHYDGMLGWCRLLLKDAAPMPGHGDLSVNSFLFNSHRIFERYVAIKLGEAAAHCLPAITLEDQVSLGPLLDGDRDTDLRPDLLLRSGNSTVAVMDTKWKLPDNKAGASGDRYQLYAYGRFSSRSGQEGRLNVVLIYPCIGDASAPVAERRYLDQMQAKVHLSVLYYNLQTDELHVHKKQDWDSPELEQLIKRQNERASAARPLNLR